MNTWHPKPKSCQWSKKENVEHCWHYSNSNPFVIWIDDNKKLYSAGLGTSIESHSSLFHVHWELGKTSIAALLLFIMAVYKNKKSPSTQIILKINPRKSLTPSVTGLQRRIVQKFGSIHTLNNIGFLPQWSLAGSLLFARSNRVYEGNKIEWKDNFSHRMEKT